EATRHALAEAVSQTGLPLVVHAEDPTQFRSDAPAHDPVEWDRERPRTAEMRGVESMLNSPSSLRLHFAHLTSSAAVEAVRTAGFSCEAAPHHLLLAAHESDDARWKTNPPLRTESVRQQLFESFQKGRVPILSSDHAPHFASEKSVPFDRAPSGVPGLATMIPLFLLEVREGRISLETLQSAACDRPARWAGVPQGRIAPGHRARLLAIDFRRRARVDARRLRIRCGWTPFEGREAIFPLEHLFDGEPLVADGEIVGGRKGQIVRPEYAPGARQRPESMA
ncbi:MAG TPA: hypothetical protein VJS68_00270, partial [Thermoplasmata archaeon]|nr:hypothetical protein [Thermoplasmata archaeon]